jgi:hypothetical protein
MKGITISFSKDRFDQWRLSQAGGSITFDRRGQPVFSFPNQQSFDQYLSLNERRRDFGDGAPSSPPQLH